MSLPECTCRIYLPLRKPSLGDLSAKREGFLSPLRRAEVRSFSACAVRRLYLKEVDEAENAEGYEIAGEEMELAPPNETKEEDQGKETDEH